VVFEPEVEKKLKTALALVVKQCRRGQTFDFDAFKRCCKMLMELDPGRTVYERIFELDFLQRTVEYYTVRWCNVLYLFG
jgi:hypothetical protein